MTQQMVDLNVNVENLVESDDIVTVQNIESDEYSAAASLNDNFQELEKPVQNGNREPKRFIQNDSNTINPDTSPKMQVALFVWKKQEVKSITTVERVTASEGLCTVI